MPLPRVSPAAQQDIDELYLHGIVNYGLRQADDYFAGLKAALMLLGDNPMMGRERDEIRPPIRLLRYQAHHLFYDVIEGGVLLQRVLHHSSDWTASF